MTNLEQVKAKIKSEMGQQEQQDPDRAETDQS